ncbi:MAG: hypothetical protein HOW97_24350 [Catenulispora sp.]|nr:hypothetical protein [Catenulispora sp.]
MVLTRLKHRDEAPPVVRPRAATHLSGWRDDSISFADIRALPEPEWADTNPASRARFWPGRFTVGALVPAGQLAAVPLPDPTETVIADIRAILAELAPYTAKAGA